MVSTSAAVASAPFVFLSPVAPFSGPQVNSSRVRPAFQSRRVHFRSEPLINSVQSRGKQGRKVDGASERAGLHPAPTYNLTPLFCSSPSYRETSKCNKHRRMSEREGKLCFAALSSSSLSPLSPPLLFDVKPRDAAVLLPHLEAA